eukprot:scaffold10787_cov123-Isochrysis_galbana.AAC.6
MHPERILSRLLRHTDPPEVLRLVGQRRVPATQQQLLGGEPAPPVPNVELGAVLDQQADYLGIDLSDRLGERRAADRVGSIDVGTSLDERGAHSNASRPGGGMQRSGAVPITVAVWIGAGAQ